MEVPCPRVIPDDVRDVEARCRGARLHLAAAGECPPERDLVRILEVAADRQAAPKPGDTHAAAQAVGDVRSGRLAGPHLVPRAAPARATARGSTS